MIKKSLILTMLLVISSTVFSQRPEKRHWIDWSMRDFTDVFNWTVFYKDSVYEKIFVYLDEEYPEQKEKNDSLPNVELMIDSNTVSIDSVNYLMQIMADAISSGSYTLPYPYSVILRMEDNEHGGYLKLNGDSILYINKQKGKFTKDEEWPDVFKNNMFYIHCKGTDHRKYIFKFNTKDFTVNIIEK